MQSDHYTKANLAVTLMSSSLSADLHSAVALGARAELMSMSEYIRCVLTKWVDAGSPLHLVSMDKFRISVAAYFTDVQYHTIRDVSKRRRISVAHAMRIALTWYTWHRK